MPPIYQEVRDWQKMMQRASNAGYHLGCATSPERFADWFSPAEMSRLRSLGFQIVDCSGCGLLMATKTQLIIGSRFPLKYLRPVAMVSA